MDKCTHEVRMEYWKNIITQCQNRPEGQSAKQWMDANGICEGTYYLWQKRIRQQTYEQMVENKPLLPAAKKTEEITFAELPIPQAGNVLNIPAPFEPSVRTLRATLPALRATYPVSGNHYSEPRKS